MKSKKKINYKKERAILSDVLPYELPICFTNRHIYRFVTQYGIEIKNNKVYINNKEFEAQTSRKKQVVYDVLAILLGCNKINRNECDISTDSWRKPFIYKVSHKESDFRELAIIHPKNQLELVELYDINKELMLYYSSISKFSIRKPSSIARYVYYKDKLHRALRGNPKDNVENYHNEYENLRTFFAYKEYSNIFRFYEDYRYQRAEKKFQRMVKFDISKCFDSIYTHSIVWALYNKSIVKDNLKWSENTFAGQFDKFMQSINYGETNGILIGPEFSRIFAELILQQIDNTVEHKLQIEGLYHQKHYECYRYVDDYFLFYNTIEERERIMSIFRHELKEYKLSVSDAKTIHYEKPIVTDITVAKFKIVDLINESIKFKIEEIEEAIEGNECLDSDFFIKDSFAIYLNPNKIIAKYKSILKESNVQYKDVINYTLAALSRKIESLVKKVDDKMREYAKLHTERNLNKQCLKKKYNLEKTFTTFILNILDFVFFIYAVNPKVNTTIKLSLILNVVIRFFNGKHYFTNTNINGTKQRININRFERINKDLVYKKIQDEIRLVLEKNKIANHTQVETLYLLIILKELGTEYMLPESILLDYFCVSKMDNGNYKCITKINVISMMVILSYVENNTKYNNIRSAICDAIDNKVRNTHPNNRRQNSEITILVLDSLACPYIDEEFKKNVLSLLGINDARRQSDIINFCVRKQRYWFTKWGKLNLTKELNAKISAEVYS